MAVSGSFDFTMTRDQIITDALYNIQAIPIGQTPKAKDIALASRALNRLIKRLQQDHVYINAVTLRTFNTVAGTASTQLASGTKKVLGTPFLRIDNNDTPLEVISRQDYDTLVSKSAQGQPDKVYFDSSTSPPTAYLYPTPAAVYAFYYRTEDVLDDVDQASDNVNLPVSALDMLVAGLAYELCLPYRQTTSFRQELGARFEQLKREYKSGDINRDGSAKVAPHWVV